MSENGFCNCFTRSVDTTQDYGKLFLIVGHYSDCVEYRAALDDAAKMADDYPRLQSDFDDAMSMLKIANDRLKAIGGLVHQTLELTDE